MLFATKTLGPGTIRSRKSASSGKVLSIPRMRPKTRKVLLRIGFVLGKDGGALPVLAGLTKRFLGGAVGNGKQYISWIHLADLAQMFVEAIERETLIGVFNGTASAPVMNKEFMRELRRVLHRPWSPPAPEWMVKIGSHLMGSEPSLALASQRCVPQRFLEAGFKFQFADLRRCAPKPLRIMRER